MKSALPAIVAAACWMWCTTGTACAVPGSLADVRAEVGASQRSALLQRRVAFSRPAALRARSSNASRSARDRRCCTPPTGVARYVGSTPGRLHLQYEGMNPSGSFKDNGMSAAFSHARLVGATRAACASTGNTSASLALYCSVTRLMKAVIFIGSGKISYGKLSQALDYGALTVQIAGDFDDAMARVQEVSKQLGIYLVNSVNPFRLEGQKTIMFRVLEGLGWAVPDWIVVPGGNLGNSSAFGKAFHELHELGLIDRIPRLAVINAAGANTLYELVEQRGLRWNDGRPNMETSPTRYFDEMDAQHRRASTIASAIEINRPVNLTKCLRALEWCNGVVREVTDQEILDAKAQVGAGGMGCEPASAASVAGVKELVAEGVIGARRTRRLHPHRPSTQRPHGHRGLSLTATKKSSTKCSAAAAFARPRSPTAPSPCPTTSTKSSKPSIRIAKPQTRSASALFPDPRP